MKNVIKAITLVLLVSAQMQAVGDSIPSKTYTDTSTTKPKWYQRPFPVITLAITALVIGYKVGYASGYQDGQTEGFASGYGHIGVQHSWG